jgi:arylsulfatase A-like enzyme
MKILPSSKNHLIGGLCLAALCLLASRALSAETMKPNVVFILADDLGWSDTTLYGTTKFFETPNIERLASSGMTFQNAYAANPLCSPTRASILTGLYPGRIGITTPCCHEPEVRLEEKMIKKAPALQPALQMISASRLRTNFYTMAEAFQEAGYVTGHFGKWHLGAEPYSPLQHGFDVDVPHYSGPGPAGSYVAPWHFPKPLNFTGQPGEHIEDRMTDEAIHFLKANQHHPFFLNYWAFSVHAPFDAKTNLIAKYRAKADPKDAQRCAVYGAMVQSLDENVGRLLDELDALKLTDNTIIVFFSDNGGNMYDRVDGIPPTSNRPLRGGKATIYEGGTREPCVVVWPGKVKAGSRSEAFLSSVDWFPTLLEMAQIKPQRSVKFDGVNQTPALLGSGTPRDTAICYYPHYTPATGARPAISVRRGDWKLIRFYCDSRNQSDRFELYNLKEDLGETNNLASAKPDRVRQLNSLLEDFHRETGALVPAKNPAFNPDAVVPPEKGKAKDTAAPQKSAERDLRKELERASDAGSYSGS